VSQLDQCFVHFAVIWDKGKDVWRDPIDGCESVLDGPGNEEHLQRILFQCVDLEWRGVLAVGQVEEYLSW